MLAVIILAGGESKRMGSPKLLLNYKEQSLLVYAIRKAQQLSSMVFVVVGRYADVYRPEAEKSGATAIENPEWPEGLASSLRSGIASLPVEVDVALVLLPDQPFVPLEHLQALIKVQQRTRAQLVFSSYDGVLGAPTLIHHSLFDRVQYLKGNIGAKALIQEEVSVASVLLEASLDIDTPEDALKL